MSQLAKDIGKVIAEMLNISPQEVLGIDLHIHVNEPPTCDVKVLVDVIVEEIRKYKLTP